MTIKIVTSWVTLMQYAKEVGAARKSGDEERLNTALDRFNTYRDMCLQSDEMHTGRTVGEMFWKAK